MFFFGLCSVMGINFPFSWLIHFGRIFIEEYTCIYVQNIYEEYESFLYVYRCLCIHIHTHIYSICMQVSIRLPFCTKILVM